MFEGWWKAISLSKGPRCGIHGNDPFGGVSNGKQRKAGPKVGRNANGSEFCLGYHIRLQDPPLRGFG